MKLKDPSLKLKAGFLWNARYGSVVYSWGNWKVAPEKLKKTQGFMFKSDFLGDSGSDEVTECYGETECYVEDASPLINSSPVAQTVSRRRRQSLLSGDSPTGDVGLCISAWWATGSAYLWNESCSNFLQCDNVIMLYCISVSAALILMHLGEWTLCHVVAGLLRYTRLRPGLRDFRSDLTLVSILFCSFNSAF